MCKGRVLVPLPRGSPSRGAGRPVNVGWAGKAPPRRPVQAEADGSRPLLRAPRQRWGLPPPPQLRPSQRGCPSKPQFLRSLGTSGGTLGLPQSPPRTSRQVWRDTRVVCAPQGPGKPLLPARRCLGCIPCAGESICHLHYLQGPLERVRTAWAAPCFSGTAPSAPAPARPSLKTTL